MPTEHEDENELNLSNRARIEHDPVEDSTDELLEDFSDDDARVEHRERFPVDDPRDDVPVDLPPARRDRGNLGQFLLTIISVASLIAVVSVGWYVFNRLNDLSDQISALRNSAPPPPADSGSSTFATSEVDRLNGVVADLSQKLDALAGQGSSPTPATDPPATQPLVDVSTSSDAVDQVADELRKQQEILDAMSRAKDGEKDSLRLNSAMGRDPQK